MKTASTAIQAELCEMYGGSCILKKHASIDEFRAQASADERECFSFTGVRNPMDVAVSRYVMRKQGLQREKTRSNFRQYAFIKKNSADFNAYFQEFVGRRNWVGIGIVPTDWKKRSFQSINYIYRYENLHREFPLILNMLGLNLIRPLPPLNISAAKLHFMDYYDAKSLKIARKAFGKYMRRWGYEVP